MRASVFILLAPIGLAATYSGFAYYRLVWLHIQSRQALQQVERQLDNHHNSIPTLLLALSNYLRSETQLIEHVLEARMRSLKAATSEERLIASAHLSQALHHLFRASETCIEFHRDDEAALVHMQVMLSEQKIALARDYYNHVITHYNRRISQFPHNLIAQIAGLEKKQLFELPAHALIEC